MILIQVIVTIIALGIVLFGLVGRQTHATRAWKKILLAIFAMTMVVAVLLPDTTTQVAHVLGVGRGADLLLYMLTLAFIGYVINNYLHQQSEKDTVHRLARKVALLDAYSRYNMKEKLGDEAESKK